MELTAEEQAAIAANPGKDWIVMRVQRVTFGGGLHISGINRCAMHPSVALPARFSWTIGHHSILCSRTGWAGASWGPGAMDHAITLAEFAARGAR